jgi:hypothetical protein
MFASYLVTSFQLAKTRWVSDGCACSFCGYLVAVPHLQARTPSRLDRELARKLKVIALEKLALEYELPLFANEVERFLDEHPELDRDVAIVAHNERTALRPKALTQGQRPA